ncbi:wax ester/triacylglycerol synthase domain-containing protein [Actinokineospora inagensis]|uniref:wax ester/triacylglycerol synthase domain-containing protein n=1 Tax=Actinokineospora inagensis TaxID=103730 RepID=UPI0004244F37|nr:wax ester/triacylglycerol synthase domain-containing protein [Actinokineospora inagensis]
MPHTVHPLSVVDRIVFHMVRQIGDPALHLGLLMRFDGAAPSLTEITEHLAPRVANTPELRHRLGGPTRRPHWEPDPAFDLIHHVHEHTLAEPSDDPDPILTALHCLPLDRERPLWGVWLIRGVHGYALCYRAHHAFQDGLTAMRTCEALFGIPRPTPVSAAPPALSLRDKATFLRGVVIEDLLPSLRPNTHWSGLDEPLSGQRVALTTTVDLPRLHAIGRATNTTLNHICLAALTATLRSWHPHDWTRPGSGLRTSMAINVRDPHEPLPLLGNRVGVASVFLPTGEPEPLQRLARVKDEAAYRRLTATGRRHRFLYRHIPYRIGLLATTRSTNPRTAPLTLADVRPRGPLTFAGTTAVSAHILPVAVPNQPLFAAWTTHGGQLHTTFLIDTALSGYEQLPTLWHNALDALEHTAPPPTTSTAG